MISKHKTKWTVISLKGMQLLFDTETEAERFVTGYGGQVLPPYEQSK